MGVAQGIMGRSGRYLRVFLHVWGEQNLKIWGLIEPLHLEFESRKNDPLLGPTPGKTIMGGVVPQLLR